MLRESIEVALPSIVETLVRAAIAGDVMAARCLLDRSIATLRPVEPAVKFKLPAGSLTEQGKAVLAAIATGELAPASAAQIVAALVGIARIADTDEILTRIEKMEAAIAANHKQA